MTGHWYVAPAPRLLSMPIVTVISSVKLFWIPYKNVFGGGEYMGRLYKACKEDSKLEVVEETHV